MSKIKRYQPDFDKPIAGFILLLGYTILVAFAVYLLAMWLLFKPLDTLALRAVVAGIVFLQIGYLFNKE
jgi:hypothetical protein